MISSGLTRQRASSNAVRASISAKTPYDAQGIATLENSLLHQAWQKGWAVNDTGGITHQAVAGFTQTGSAGGSLVYGFNNIIAYRIIDGTGNAEWIDNSDTRFDAIAVSMGLLGLITRVRLQLVPTYNIVGQENAVPPVGATCPVDVFGPGDGRKTFDGAMAEGQHLCADGMVAAKRRRARDILAG